MSASVQNLRRRNGERHIWFQGDCTKLLKSIKDETVSLVVTSPPYNIGKEYEGTLDLSAYLIWQRRIIQECTRVLTSDGSICWQVGNYVRDGRVLPLDIVLFPIFRELGLQLRNRIVWTYPHGLHSSNRFSGRYETIMWFTKSDKYHFDLDSVRVPQLWPKKRFYKGPRKGELSCNPLGKNPGDLWAINNVKNAHVEKIEGGHPCQFPVELVERLILSMTEEDDIVLDPFGGVATTVVSALRNNRVGFGAELNQQYFRLGKQRIKLYLSGKLPVQTSNISSLGP